MSRRPSSLGFFGIFGRSEDLRSLDRALRAADMHPALVPEGVKLAAVNLLKDRNGGGFPPEEAYGPAADILAYCIIGAGAFGQSAGAVHADAVEARIERAVDTGSGLDCDLVLLTMHAKLIQPSVVDRFGLEIVE